MTFPLNSIMEAGLQNADRPLVLPMQHGAEPLVHIYFISLVG